MVVHLVIANQQNLGCTDPEPLLNCRKEPRVRFRVADFRGNEELLDTLQLGQARGVAMLVPAIAGMHVAEYAPNLVKKTIVGAGHSEKAQIRMMIGVLLPKADPQTDDAADALAVAVCHAHHRQGSALRVATP